MQFYYLSNTFQIYLVITGVNVIGFFFFSLNFILLWEDYK